MEKQILETQINEQEEKLTNLNMSIQNSKVRIDMMEKQKDGYQKDLTDLGISPNKVKSEIVDINKKMNNLYLQIVEALPLKLLLLFKYIDNSQIELLQKGLSNESFSLAEELYEKTLQLKQSALSKKDIYEKQRIDILKKLKEFGITEEQAETKLSEINTQMNNIYNDINSLVPNLNNPN